MRQQQIDHRGRGSGRRPVGSLVVLTAAVGTVLAFAADAPPETGASAEPAEVASAHHWPQWRGPLGSGVAPHAEPPVQWSEERNVRWKLELPGDGHSTPVVWGDRVFLTAAIPAAKLDEPTAGHRHGDHDNRPVTYRMRFVVLAVGRASGEVLWQTTVGEGVPHEGGHATSSFASPSPVTDGEHLIASFGSQGLFGLTPDGKVVWKHDLGDMHTKHGHGEGSSPALHGNTVVVNWDHEGPSFVVAFDKRTGKERWRVARDEPSSWATPLVVEHEGKAQVIVPGTGRLRSYDLESGEMIWSCGGLSANIVASPVAGDGMVFVGSSYDTRALLAIRLAGARGDITGSDHVVWTRTRGTPYVPSPLLYDGALYFLQHYQGVLTRVDAATGGNRPGPMRLPEVRNIYASPVAAAGRVYVTDRNGVTVVLAAGAEGQVLAVNRLDDRFSASAAVAGGEIFLRGERWLYSLAEEG